MFVADVKCSQATRRLFQIRGLAAPKLLSPKLLCVRGTAHTLSEEDRRDRRSKGPGIYIGLPPLTGKPYQQRFTMRSGVLAIDNSVFHVLACKELFALRHSCAV